MICKYMFMHRQFKMQEMFFENCKCYKSLPIDLIVVYWFVWGEGEWGEADISCVLGGGREIFPVS